MKTAILHDMFICRWWGEKLMIMMGKILESDMVSWFYSTGSYDLRKSGFTGKMIAVSSERFKGWMRHIRLKWDFMFRTGFVKDYDTVIFSGDCLSAVRNCRRDARKIYYCHTPPRYMYDLYDFYLGKVPFLLRPVFRILSYLFTKRYEKDISQMDLILANSRNIQSRIKKYLKMDSTILYPPVDLSEFKYIGTGDYYFSFGRLASAKRVDRIVEAFKLMPDKKLIVSYGENDPQKQEIFDMAVGHKNIEFVTFDENDMHNGKLFREYVGGCIATVYIPVNEDFGMIPIESMGAWKPVLGANEWGLQETIIDRKTGFFTSPEARIEEIVSGVEYLSRERSIEMRQDCEARAQEFSIQAFEKKLKELVG